MPSQGQCRAARYLLNLSQQDLADAAGIARSTITEFERGARAPTPSTLIAMRTALEAAGVDTVKELRRRNAANLLNTMVEVNKKKRLVRRLPTEAMVGRWVDSVIMERPLGEGDTTLPARDSD